MPEDLARQADAALAVAAGAAIGDGVAGAHSLYVNSNPAHIHHSVHDFYNEVNDSSTAYNNTRDVFSTYRHVFGI